MIFEFIPCFEDYTGGFSTQKDLSHFFANPRSLQEVILYWLKDTQKLSFGRVVDEGDNRLYVGFESKKVKYGFASTPLVDLTMSLPSIDLLSEHGASAINAWFWERNKRLEIREDMFSSHTFAPASAVSELVTQYAQSIGGLATIEMSKTHPGLGSVLLIFSPDAIDMDEAEETEASTNLDVSEEETECLGWHESALFSIDELKHYCILDAAVPGSYHQ
jgi:hypothetical protein